MCSLLNKDADCVGLGQWEARQTPEILPRSAKGRASGPDPDEVLAGQLPDDSGHFHLKEGGDYV